MLKDLVFDLKNTQNPDSKPGVFLSIAALITVAYVLFALVLVGVPQLSRGGVVVTVVGFAWFILGAIAGRFVIPKVMLLPIVYYLTIVITGFLLPIYPFEYVGQMTTIWVGAITIALFVANGVSINLIVNLIVAGFLLTFLANVAAISVGYDGFQININQQSQQSLEFVDIKRVSGLAGQPNLLVAITFTLPFLLFLMRRRLGVVWFVSGVAGCVLMMVLTASRSTIPFTFIFMVLGSLFLIKNNFIRLIFILSGLIGVVLFYFILQDPDLLSKIEYSPLGELQITERVLRGLDGFDNSADTRSALATDFWGKYYEQPIIGFGPNQFATVVGDGFYAHNNFAEIAVNFGSVGLVIYYSMYALVAFAIIKYLPINYFLIAPLMFLILADFAFVTYTERAMVLCLTLMLVISFSIRKSRRRRRRIKQPVSSHPGKAIPQ